MKKSFVRRENKNILNLKSKPFTLKGVGIGGWLLFEGYMFKSFGEIDRQWRFEELLERLVGEQRKEEFFKQFRLRFFSEKDIVLIKKSGFNSIRIPLDYQFLFKASSVNETLDKVEENFLFLDKIIETCKKHEVFVILDLHVAPGGQTGTNIDNSKNNIPELFTNDLYKKQIVYIWKEIAKRYYDEAYIACYDLMNEPLPKWFLEYSNHLIPLYKDIIKAIREVDKNHMITLEGLVWSTDLSIFTELLDPNLLLQFHKYWSSPDKESLEQYLMLRDTLNVPIIMGEGGENNSLWYSAVFKLYDQLNISYNFWTYKKMDNTNSIISFKEPNNWQLLIASKLNETLAQICLNDLLDNILYDNCIYNQSVVNHILRLNNFATPGYAFDFFDESFKSISNKKSSIRKNSNISIVNEEDQVIAPNFKQYSGEAVPKKDILYLNLLRNEYVEYTFYTEKKINGVIKIEGKGIENLNIFLNKKPFNNQENKYSCISKKGENILKLESKESCMIQTIEFNF